MRNYKKFDFRKEFEFATEEERVDLHFVMSKVAPYWECAVRIDAETRFRLAQANTFAVLRQTKNWRIESIRGKIMNRLRQEEADRRGHGDVDKLYLHYPHSLVDKEYPIRQEWRISICELDRLNISKALKLANLQDELPKSETYHLESMLETYDLIRKNLGRKYLMVFT